MLSYPTLQHRRVVPAKVKMNIYFNRFSTLFGLFFLIISSVFFIVFGSFVKFETIADSSPLTEGVISYVIPTSTSINDKTVYEFHYEYKTPDGSHYYSVSYSEDLYYPAGSTVRVLYSKDNPTDSRIQGMRSGLVGPWILLVIIPFFLIGLAFFVFGVIKSKKEIYLLQVGEVGYGKLLMKEPTNVKVNEQMVYKLHFKFTASDGKEYKAVCKTHKPHWLEDEEKEKLVYDPNFPEHALMLDSLPQKLKKYFDTIED